MKKTRNIIRFIDNLLAKFRKVLVNTVTFILLTGFTLVFLFSLGSLFESDEIETKNQILYLEPKGLIVDKAITRNDPFEDLEIFESSTNQIELKNIFVGWFQHGRTGTAGLRTPAADHRPSP